MFFDNRTHSGFLGNAASVYLGIALFISSINQYFEEANRNGQMREILDEETYLQTPKPNNCIAVSPSTERKVSVRVFHASTFERSLRDLLPFVASIPERKIGLGTAPEYIIGPCDVFKEGIPVFKDFQSAADANALNRKEIALKFQEARTHQGDMGQLVISDPAPKILAP